MAGRLLIAGIMLAMAWAVPANAQPSFDCATAKSAVEHAICAMPSLAEADAKLARAYKTALTASLAAPQAVKAAQSDWLKDRNARCRPGDPPRTIERCLEETYAQRQIQLTAPACHAIGAAIKVGPLPKGRSIAMLVAEQPGSALSYEKTISGYSLESTVQGSMACLTTHLFHTAGREKTEIPTPSGYGAEDEEPLCGDVDVDLISFNGVPGLLEEETGSTHRVSLALRTRNGWSPGCSVTVTTSSSRRVASARCREPNCNRYSQIALGFSQLNRSPSDDDDVPSADNLSPENRKAFDQLSELAAKSVLSQDFEVPFFGTDAEKQDMTSKTNCNFYFDGMGGRLFPVVTEAGVLLGKIGNDGFGLGAHAGGPNDAIAFYGVENSKLVPVAGVCVVVDRVSIESIKVNP